MAQDRNVATYKCPKDKKNLQGDIILIYSERRTGYFAVDQYGNELDWALQPNNTRPMRATAESTVRLILQDNGWIDENASPKPVSVAEKWESKLPKDKYILP